MRMLRKVLPIWAPWALLLVQIPTALPAAGAGGIEPVASVEGIDQYQLPNGLSVRLFPEPSKETITVNVTYLVGSRHENYG